MWICPYCGAENWQSDRIGLSEPMCRDCKRERKPIAELRKEIKEEIKELETDMKDLRWRMESHLEMISSLEDELSQERCDYEELKKDYLELKQERDSLEEKEFYTSHDKERAARNNKFQKLLSDFIIGGLFRKKRKNIT